MNSSETYWIKLNSDVVKSINSLDSTKFQSFLSFIFEYKIKRLFNHQDSNFKETSKIYDELNLKGMELLDAFNTLEHLLKQSHYILMKPTDLHDDLVNKLQFDVDKADIFMKFWIENVKKDFGQLADRKRVENMSWSINMKVASDLEAKKVVPSFLVQLDVKNKVGEMERVTMELDEGSLEQMYENIDTLQTCLDDINQ